MQEMELKLELSEAGASSLLEKNPFGQSPTILRQTSVYFDTVEGDLSKRGLSLRIRQCGEESIQTVKSGHGSAARRRCHGRSRFGSRKNRCSGSRNSALRTSTGEKDRFAGSAVFLGPKGRSDHPRISACLARRSAAIDCLVLHPVLSKRASRRWRPT